MPSSAEFALASSGQDPMWCCCEFTCLTPVQLQNIYAARQAVFVVEQQCIYMDVDGMDDRAWHLAAWSTTQPLPLAYARIFPPGVKYAEASVGRVLTTTTARGRGLGRELVDRAVHFVDQQFVGAAVRISAQAHLKAFYEGFAFQARGAVYLEDGIPHLDMLRPSVG